MTPDQLAFRKALVAMIAEVVTDTGPTNRIDLARRALEHGYQLGLIAAVDECERYARSPDAQLDETAGPVAVAVELSVLVSKRAEAIQDPETEKRCVYCNAKATHAGPERAWCDKHTPWPVHWKECGSDCAAHLKSEETP